MKKYLLLLLTLTGCVSTQKDLVFEPEPENIFKQRLLNEMGVIRDPSKALPQMPKVEYHQPGISDFEAKKQMKVPLYNLGHALLPDRNYIKIKHSSFIDFNKWFRDSTLHIWHKQLDDGYDCDNFAFLYKALLGVSSYKNNNKKEVLAGVIYVRQKKAFGGIAGGDYYHALNIVGTSAGWFVYEPQTGYYDRLEHYKNKIIWYLF